MTNPVTGRHVSLPQRLDTDAESVERDLMKLVQTVPGNEAYRPIREGNCAFLAK